jgi:putative tricarboxylic transport membrane protein
VFKKLDYPIAPLVLAIVLGDRAEDAFRQSMLMSQGSLGIFFSNPLVATMVILAIALVVVPLLLQLKGRGMRAQTSAAPTASGQGSSKQLG